MIIAIGLNHKTAPLVVREQLAFDASLKCAMLKALNERFPSAEFVLLSTCNRVELYCASVVGEGPSPERLMEMLGRARRVEHAEFQPYLYVHRNEEAVRHLLMVASSLDSMVVGETEILGQVKESYRLALEAGSTGRILNRLFHLAVATAKKIHTETALASSRTSVPGLAVELVGRSIPDHKSAKVLVIGAGDMGELFVQLLQKSGFRQITVVNRTSGRGADLAARLGVATARWDRLGEQLAECDVAVSCTASTEPVVTKDQMAAVLKQRKGDILIVDIGVPRDFDADILELPGIRLFTIDELSPLICEELSPGSDQLARAFDTVYGTSAEFMQWYASRDIGPLIGQMQEKFRQIAAMELGQRLSEYIDSSTREELETIVSRIVGKLSHAVISHVDLVTHEHGPEHAAGFLMRVLEHAEEVYADPTVMEELVK
jgi:glutamyl-tRNA reductase